MPPQEDVQKFRVCIVKMIGDNEKKLAKDPVHTQFICSVNSYQYKYIMPYNDIINNISNQEY